MLDVYNLNNLFVITRINYAYITANIFEISYRCFNMTDSLLKNVFVILWTREV